MKLTITLWSIFFCSFLRAQEYDQIRFYAYDFYTLEQITEYAINQIKENDTTNVELKKSILVLSKPSNKELFQLNFNSRGRNINLFFSDGSIKSVVVFVDDSLSGGCAKGFELINQEYFGEFVSLSNQPCTGNHFYFLIYDEKYSIEALRDMVKSH